MKENHERVEHPGEDEKFSTKRLVGVVKEGRIYLDRKGLFDKPQKCPIACPIPKTPDEIKRFIEDLEWLFSKEGYSASRRYDTEKWRRIDNKQELKAKILIDDLAGRFKAGEIGKIIENDFPEKYDYKVLLPGTEYTENFMGHGPINAIREFYFCKNEVELIEEE